jgi:hypothetical protein
MRKYMDKLFHTFCKISMGSEEANHHRVLDEIIFIYANMIYYSAR